MDPDELLKLLALDAPDPLPPSATGEIVGDEPDPAASPTALTLDDWSLRRGDEFLADTPSAERWATASNGRLGRSQPQLDPESARTGKPPSSRRGHLARPTQDAPRAAVHPS